MIVSLFPLALCLSASLLFMIQPMAAKVLLPVYGGTPAVWTVCMLFFQLLILVAYGYAWVLSRMGLRLIWRWVHGGICLFSLCMLPLGFQPTSSLGAPELHILLSLLWQLGLPLLVVGVSAPLLQYAYSQTKALGAGDPYFLYVASNAGSLMALLSYPFVIERFMGVHQQFYMWTIVYLVYLALLFLLLFMVPYAPKPLATSTRVSTTWSQRGSWVFLSFVPCSLMLGVTFYISTDIAATPLLWVLPLALYLLSFMLTFAQKPLIAHAWVVRHALLFLVCPILSFIIGSHQFYVQVLMIIHLFVFFMLALLCHGELVRCRPPALQLTSFYLCLSVGGVLAGLFNGLLAPRLFSHAYEYPLMILFVLFCIPKEALVLRKSQLMPAGVLIVLLLSHWLPDHSWLDRLKTYHLFEIFALIAIVRWPGSTLRVFIGMSILFACIFLPFFNPTAVLTQQRNFYGIKHVFSQAGAHVLMSQSTIHGFQIYKDTHPNNGAHAYYGAVLPVVQGLQAVHQPLHAMVLGLGTGLMACQFRAEDQLTMVEIDQQMIDIATNPSLFTYLRDCPPRTALIKEDGLLAVSQTKDASYDLLVMDAFNSDAVPVHLLTMEAFSSYKQKITEDGAILVNITNRHLALLPVLNGAGRALDMIVLYSAQPANHRLGQFAAEWVLLTTNMHLASGLMGKQGWRFVTDGPSQLWTNDYSNIMPLLKFKLLS